MALEMYVHPVPETSAAPLRSRPGRRARRLLTVVLLAALAVAAVLAVANVVLVARLERIENAFAGLTDRPAGSPGSTYLMVATRPGASGSPDVPWLEGDQSVEAVMLVVVADDNRSARVETLPPRSGVAAIAAGSRPSTTVGAVEAWSGRRVDHLIAVDWTTFVRLASDNGVDPAYAYGSAPAVQHEFLERVMRGTLHAELRKKPLELYRALTTTVEGAAVDDDWSVLGLDRTVFSLRDLRSNDITYTMAEPG